ncbi:hypothetical protein QJS10_CPB04g01826 [Acorus calamus]|uniref:Uncharacterized protein n=1 Tax=Acorus calamus TaxID=4465 RepID=A0AAV9F1A1_ACOCL|nr:hypothetical protein QJS10_CPB04g01826 [Acorus calamus]
MYRNSSESMRTVRRAAPGRARAEADVVNATTGRLSWFWREISRMDGVMVKIILLRLISDDGLKHKE